MNILHILASGDVGGIERQCFDEFSIAKNHYFCFIKRYGYFYKKMKNDSRTIGIFDNKGLNFFKVIIAYKKIMRFIKKNTINKVIFEVMSPAAHLIALMICKKKIPTFCYMHSSFNDYPKKKLNLFVFPLVLKKTNGIIAISNYVKKSILDVYPSFENRIHVLYNGTVLNGELKNQNLNSPIKFVYVGRIIKAKGIENDVEFITKNFSNYSFDIIGDGPQLKEYTEKYESDKIHFLGRVTENLNDVLQQYDYFIHMPNWEEGFGIAIIEALKNGLPVICTNKGALNEIIINGYNGYIIENMDKIDMQIKDYETYKKICINAFQSSKRFSIENTIKSLDEL